VEVELNEALEQRKEIDEIVSKFYNQPIDQHNSEGRKKKGRKGKKVNFIPFSYSIGSYSIDASSKY